MDAQFLSLAQGLEVPQAFISFLEKHEIVDTDAFALLAAKEDTIEKNIIEIAKADQVDLTALKDKIAIKKLWMSCRRSLGNWQGGGANM